MRCWEGEHVGIWHPGVPKWDTRRWCNLTPVYDRTFCVIRGCQGAVWERRLVMFYGRSLSYGMVDAQEGGGILFIAVFSSSLPALAEANMEAGRFLPRAAKTFAYGSQNAFSHLLPIEHKHRHTGGGNASQARFKREQHPPVPIKLTNSRKNLHAKTFQTRCGYMGVSH